MRVATFSKKSPPSRPIQMHDDDGGRTFRMPGFRNFNSKRELIIARFAISATSRAAVSRIVVTIATSLRSRMRDERYARDAAAKLRADTFDGE